MGRGDWGVLLRAFPRTTRVYRLWSFLSLLFKTKRIHGNSVSSTKKLPRVFEISPQDIVAFNVENELIWKQKKSPQDRYMGRLRSEELLKDVALNAFGTLFQ